MQWLRCQIGRAADRGFSRMQVLSNYDPMLEFLVQIGRVV